MALRLKNTALMVSGLLVVGGVTILGSTQLAKALTVKSESATCTGRPSQTHTAVISNETVTPEQIIAKRCEALSITNLDDKTRLVAFGQHDKHTSYDGVSEKLLAKGESFTITLVQTGEFLYHDHDDETVKGTFSVFE